jgi:hypothetical protein
LRSAAAQSLAANAIADALPLFEVLASGDAAGLQMPLSASLSLEVAFVPRAVPGA